MKKTKHADKTIFWVCLILAAGLFVGGFFCPPMGVIDGSVLKAGGILVAMQALGIAGQNLANGKEKTKSGLILSAASQEKPQIAEVVAVGPGGLVDGKEVVMTVKVGDKVITSKYSGTEVKADGVEYTIVRQSDILAIVE